MTDAEHAYYANIASIARSLHGISESLAKLASIEVAGSVTPPRDRTKPEWAVRLATATRKV